MNALCHGELISIVTVARLCENSKLNLKTSLKETSYDKCKTS